MKRAIELQTRLGWGDLVSLNDLEKFVELYPQYCLLVMTPVKRALEATCFKEFRGASYVDGTPKCKMIFLDGHWAITEGINSFIRQMSNGGTFSFCETCVRVVKHNANSPPQEWSCWSSHTQEEEDVLEQPKKKVKVPCHKSGCAGDIHFGECPLITCQWCIHSCFQSRGGDRHRCILMPKLKDMKSEHPHNKYFNEEEQDYDFCTSSDGDGKVPAFFAYDMETMIVEEDLPECDNPVVSFDWSDDNFGVDLEEYTEIIRGYLTQVCEESDLLNSKLKLSRKKRTFKPNLVVATNIYSCKKLDGVYDPKMVRFYGDNCVVEFLDYVLSYNKCNNYVFAHNGSGFDAKFLLEAVMKTDIKYEPLMRGSSILQLRVKTSQGRCGNNVMFHDSMLHLPGSLAGLLNGFFSADDPIMSLSKGHFPHKFNTQENQNYVGPIPGIEFFSPETIKLGEGDKKFQKVLQLQEWHSSQTGEWDFQKELVKYCDSDVRGLAALLKVYMEVGIPKGAIPLTFPTMPSFVHMLTLMDITKDLNLPDVDIRSIRKVISTDNPTLDKSQVDKMGWIVRKRNCEDYRKIVEERAKTGFAVLLF